MLTTVSTGVTQVIAWVGEVLSSITDSDGALYPLLVFVGIGVGMFVIKYGLGIIRSMIQGY